jgi:hypothetical protein
MSHCSPTYGLLQLVHYEFNFYAMADAEQAAQEAAKELQTRVEAFNKEMAALLGKYELGLNAIPFITTEWGKATVNGVDTFIPPGIMVARPNLIDMRGKTPADGKPSAGLSEG